MSSNFVQKLKEKYNKNKEDDENISNILRNEKEGTEFLVQHVWKLHVIQAMKKAINRRENKITFYIPSLFEKSKFRNIYKILLKNSNYMKLMSEGIVQKAISENLKANVNTHHPSGYTIYEITITLE